jgi:hypothetical protein
LKIVFVIKTGNSFSYFISEGGGLRIVGELIKIVECDLNSTKENEERIGELEKNEKQSIIYLLDWEITKCSINLES